MNIHLREGGLEKPVKAPVKANPAEQQRGKPGGAQPGHAGHGRQAVRESDAGRIGR